jgi:hypothetical protein
MLAGLRGNSIDPASGTFADARLPALKPDWSEDIRRTDERRVYRCMARVADEHLPQPGVIWRMLR